MTARAAVLIAALNRPAGRSQACGFFLDGDSFWTESDPAGVIDSREARS